MISRLTDDGRGWILSRLAGIGICQAAILIVFATAVQRAFDSLLADSGAVDLWPWNALLVTVTLAAGALRYLERTDAERLGQRYIHAIRGQMLERLGRVSARTLGRGSRGGVLLKFVGDLTALRQWVTLGLARLGVATLTGVGTVAALAFVSGRLAIAVALIIAASGCLIVWSGRPLERAVRRARRRRGQLSSDISERVSSVAVMQANGQADRERRRVMRRSATLKDAMVERAHWAGIIRALTELAMRLGVIGVLLVGVREVADGGLSPGMLVAAMAIAGFLAAPLRELGRAYEYWQSAKVAKERVEAFLMLPDAVSESPRALKARKVRGDLRFDRVEVEGILADVSARVPAGGRVLVSGANGSGKSTLLWCAARLIDPGSGRVLLDGQDLAEIRVSSVRRNISIASADLPLMRGTVRRNLTYRDSRAPEARVESLIQRCGLERLLRELPGGLKARVTDEGRNLSVGQRQLLLLARAIFDQPRVLLLDEPDAGLDSVAVELLESLIEDYPGTVVLASHQARWESRVDEVWTLDQSRLQVTTPAVMRLKQPA